MKSYRDMARIEVRVASDSKDLARMAARYFVICANSAIERFGRFAVALSGGNTPKEFFAIVARDYPNEIDWRNVHVFWSDERCVPPTDDSSNYHMAKEQLLDQVPLPGANIHRIHVERGAAIAAWSYESELREFFKIVSGERPRFDLILLGLGPDGHTASLFPHSNALQERKHLVTSNSIPSKNENNTERVTLTYPLLNEAARILVLVCGIDKSEIVRTVLEAQPDFGDLPMHGVVLREGQITWIIDRSAGSLLCGPARSIIPD